MQERDIAFKHRLDELFNIGAHDWVPGFELVLDMGETVIGPLRRELLREPNQTRRLLWVAAYGLAARSPHTFLLARAKLDQRERVMAMLGVALGPRQTGKAKVFERALAPNTVAVEIVAAALALARFGEGPTVPQKLFTSSDPGVLASVLYASPRLKPAVLIRRLRAMRGRAAHRPLVWRGYFLGNAPPTIDQNVRDQRQQAAQTALADLRCAYRKEAAYAIATSGAAGSASKPLPASTVEGLDAETVVLLARAPGLRQQLLAAGRIPAQPSPTQAPVIRRRLVVLFASSAPVPALQAAVDSWVRGDGELMNDICLALALRLSQSGADRKLLAGSLDRLGHTGRGTALSEAGVWLRLAQGEKLATTDPQVRFKELPRPLQLAVRGAMPPATLAANIERVLWAGGAHPGRAANDLHRQFLFDLLLAKGARRGDVEPYVPKGLPDASTASFFPIANRLYEFIRTREPWALQEHRLQW